MYAKCSRTLLLLFFSDFQLFFRSNVTEDGGSRKFSLLINYIIGQLFIGDIDRNLRGSKAAVTETLPLLHLFTYLQNNYT